MQRAAAKLASVCAGLLRDSAGGVYGARVVILAGTGDNGGDALYAGERLARRGASVTAIQAGARLHAGGGRALTAAGGRIIRLAEPDGPDDPEATLPDLAGTGPAGARRHDLGHEVRSEIGHADLIIDGLLGIGGKGGLREPYATLAALADNTRGALMVAADLPSGVDADTGAVGGPAVRADVTVTFGTMKPGLAHRSGRQYAGVVEFVDIDLRPVPRQATGCPCPAVVISRNADPPSDGAVESDKYRRGVLGLLVGSDRYTGAALLATGGAVHGGAGMVRLATFPWCGRGQAGPPGGRDHGACGRRRPAVPAGRRAGPGLGGRSWHGNRRGRGAAAGGRARYQPAGAR